MPLGASRFGLMGAEEEGALTLIETQTASSSFLDFESLADYDTYLFTFDQITVSTQTEIGYRVERSGSYQASSYEYANQRNQQGGSTERRDQSQTSVRIGAGSNEFGSGCHDTAGTVTGIRFGEGIFSALDSGVISQYGLLEE